VVNPSGNGRGPAQSLTCAVVGLGYWGPNLLRVLVDRPSVEVKWICDLDGERLARFGRRYPAARRTSEIDSVLEDPTVDAVLLATPVLTHFELTQRALRAGKHTFVEKPLAPSSAKADELAKLAKRMGLVLMCDHTFVYSPPVRAIKELLDRRELGDVFFISSSRLKLGNLGLHEPDVSVIWDLGPHDFSILLHWLGEVPETVRAIGRDSIVPGIPDVAFVTLTYASGIIANVELSWLAPRKLRRTVVVGNERMVVYEDGAAEPVRVFDHEVVYQDPQAFGKGHLSYRTGDIVSPRIKAREPLAIELDDFIDAIRLGSPTVASIELSQQVIRITEAADESLRLHGRELGLANGRRGFGHHTAMVLAPEIAAAAQ
jgi:predicted dehydrogenase